MSQSSPDPPTPKSLDFVFAAGQQKIEEQLKSVDSLDVKMGVLVAFLGALVAGILAALLVGEPGKIHALLNPPSRIAWLLLGLLVLDAILVCIALVAAFDAYRPREFLSGPKFSDLFEWTNEEPADIRYVFLNTLKLATSANDKLLKPKRMSAQMASWFTLFALIALLATAVAFVLRLRLYPKFPAPRLVRWSRKMPEKTEKRPHAPEPKEPASPPERPRPKTPFVPSRYTYPPDKAVKVEWPPRVPDREPDKV